MTAIEAMSVTDEDLSYAKHIGFYEGMGFLTGDSLNDSYWHYQAQEIHSLVVIDAAGKIQSDIVMLAQSIGLSEAYHYLVFGAARRSRMIWGALRQLYALIPPDRKDPMLHDDVFEAARALNDIYIHLRGMLDNYAWALLHLFLSDDRENIHPNDVGLFRRRFIKHPLIEDFSDITDQYGEWESELKRLRDPVAHRIPLSVPPTLLDEHDQIKYRELEGRYSSAQQRFFEQFQIGASQAEIDAASAEVDAIHVQMQKIGRFVPMIVHDPAEGGTRIYPTVPQDIGQLIKLVRAVNLRIQERIAA